MKTSLINRIKNYKIDGSIVYEIAFIYCYTISFLQTTLFISFFNKSLFHFLVMPGLLLVIFKIFFLDEQRIRSFLMNLLLLALLILTWRTSTDFTLLTLGIFIIGAKGVNFRKVIKEYLIVAISALVITIVCSEIGVIRNLIYTRIGTHIHRQSFGIVYPTDFAAHVLYVFLAYIFLRFEQLSWVSYVMMLLAAILVYRFCDARFDAIALLLMIPVVIIGKRANEGYPGSYFVASFYWTIPALLAYLSQVIAYFYDRNNNIFIALNEASSGRLLLSHQAIEKYGISLFGQHVIEHGWGSSAGFSMYLKNPSSYFYIDSSYIRLLVIYGVVATLLILLAMTVISWRSMAMRSFALSSVMVIIAMSAVIEQHLIDFGYNPFLIALFANVYGNYTLLKGEKS